MRGFTLIELLIAISIVAIMATIGLIYYGSVSKSSDNTKRSEDLKKITGALEVYFNENNSYPLSGGGGQNFDCMESLESKLVPKYLPNIPTDPKSSTYCYQYRSDGKDYKLRTNPNLVGNALTSADIDKLSQIKDPAQASSWAYYTSDAKNWAVSGTTCISTTCNAPTPACGQTTTGLDNCNVACTKSGDACPPDCNLTIVCSGACTANTANACGAGSGSETSCVYTAHAAGSCNQVAAVNQSCSATCSGGSQCVSGSCQSIDLASGLVSYWKLDSITNPIVDSKGVNNGIAASTGVISTAGKVGLGIAFNNSTTSGGYINMGNNSSLYPTSDFSLSIWVKTPSPWDPTQPAHNMLNTRGIGSAGYALGILNTGFRLDIAGSPYAYLQSFPNSGSELPTGTWYHIVVTLESGTGRMYINGILVTSSTNMSIASSTYRMIIGGRDTGSSIQGRAKGVAFDEAGYWNRGLNPGEVTYLYNGGAGRTYPF